MPKVYSLEAFMHDGQDYQPGESVDVNADDAAAILGSGRGTLDADLAAAAKKQYAAAQKAAAASAVTSPSVGSPEFNAAVAAAVAAALAAQAPAQAVKTGA